jgi:hypothetical protein
MRLLRKYALFIRVGFIIAALVILELVVAWRGLAFITINSLTTTFLSGTFFIIGLILAGALSDYKEAEKIPAEFVTVLKSMHHDALILAEQSSSLESGRSLARHTEDLLVSINNNFRGNHWHKKALDPHIGEINADLSLLLQHSAPAVLVGKVRDNVTSVERLSNRVDVIIETSFIPTAYKVAEVAVAAVAFIFVFARNEWGAGGLVTMSAIVFLLASVVMLVKDMDNPFEYNKNTFADVDLSLLFRLEDYWHGLHAQETFLPNAPGPQ